ncbi:MAG TPA: PAS domain S-box protein, partial [Nodosilinea sp.]|nr:PAS domain S-box protein [Nodosilinea sp.]
MTQTYWLPSQAAAPSPAPLGQELEHLRRQHQLILNAVGEGIYGLDMAGNVTFVNPAAAAMIGWSTEELIGQSMHAVMHHSLADGRPYQREACPIYAAFQDGSVRRITNEVFWRKDGTSFPVEYISTPMRDEEGRLIGTVVTFRDITQRRWAEEVLQRANEELEQKVQERTAELQAANQQLRQLSDLRSRFVSMVCHEFRNPLNNIALTVSSLHRYDTQLRPDEKTDYLLTINANVERMTQMIDDI